MLPGDSLSGRSAGSFRTCDAKVPWTHGQESPRHERSLCLIERFWDGVYQTCVLRVLSVDGTTYIPMKKLIALIAVTAFALSAVADCGNCEAKKTDGKPKVEGKCGDKCKGDACKGGGDKKKAE